MDKLDIRKKHIQIRKEIQNKKEKSKSIVHQIINHSKYKEAHVIACYCSLNDEVNLDEIFFDAWSKGKRIVVPKVKGQTMDFYEIKNMDELEIQSYGIREPKHEVIFEKNKIDLIFVPGVVFDLDGNRMGFGKGYYDRYLSDLDVYKIGVCFQEQICEHVPTNQYDIQMNEVVIDDRRDLSDC